LLASGSCFDSRAGRELDNARIPHIFESALSKI
jgi:hypothetical protein